MTSRFASHRGASKVGLTLAVAVLLVSLQAGCQDIPPGPGATAEPTAGAATPLPVAPISLKTGYVPVLAGAALFVAQDKGYFAAEGLNIEMQSFRSGALIIQPLASGQLDIGFGEIGPAIYNAVAQGLDVRAVATASSQPPGYGSVPLLVRTDLYQSDAVTTVAALRGRKVAVNLQRSIAEYLLSEALAQAGMTIDDVTLVALPFPDVPTAFANGAIDAAILPHPLAAQTIGAGHARVLMAGDVVTENSQLAIISIGARLMQPPGADIVTRFLTAYLKGIRDIAGDGWQKEEHIAIISKYTAVPAAAVRGSVPSYFDPNGAINLESMSRNQAYFLKRGYLEYQSPLPTNKVVATTYLEKALDRVGRAK